VKKGEVMSEPTTEAGKAHVARFTPNAAEHQLAYSLVVSDTVAIEQEARANADLEPLRLLDAIDGIVDDTHPEGDGCPLCSALDDLREALSERAVQS
jgi:hypothetical protein